MNKKSLIKNKRVFKQHKRILSGLKLTDASGIAKEAFNSSNIVGTIGSMASGLGTVVESSLANAKVDTSKADNAIAAINAYEPNTSSLDAIASGYNAVNTNVGINAEDMTVSTGEGLANMGKAGLAGFTTGLQTGGIWGGIAGFFGGTAAAGRAWAKGASDAKDAEDLKRRELNIAQMSASKKAESARDTYHKNEYDNFMINHAAYGGPLYNHSGDWSNGLIFINEGGTHEENPFDGVLMGFDQEGIPNLVEEGEIIYNDYVFSNRLKPSKKQLESSGLNKKYNDWTFAKIVEDLQKASAETPLDKISKESLDDMMATMINMQEEVRMKKGLTGENRLMANGGHIFDGETDFSEWTDYDDGWLDGVTQSTFDDVAKSLKTKKKSILPYLGMAIPTIDTVGKLISNAVKPVDTSNFIQAKAYSQIPFANIGRINVRPKRETINQNAMIAPIINQSRATARDIQNLGTTGADVLNRLALNTYNTQKAAGEATLKASQMQFERDRATDALIAELQAKNAGLDQAEYAANLPVYMKRAEGLIQDAANKEIAENAKLEAQDILSASMNQGIADLTRQNIEWDWIKKVYPEGAKAIAKNGGMLTRKKRRK
jgi:hypothetical protein